MATLLALVAVLLTAQPLAAPPATRPAPLAQRVLIVSIDGLRPDLAMRADMPVLRGLMARGTYSMWAYTTPMAVTTPSHTSMLTGVTIDRHGIDFNDDRGTTRPIHPKVPTLFEVAADAGMLTAMAAEKRKFVVLNKPGTIGLVVMGEVADDRPGAFGRYVDGVVALVDDHRPDVLFWHVGKTDTVGHAIGWGSPEQMAAFEAADAALGRVLDAYGRAGLLETTAVIVSADHGGRGRVHGKNDPRSRFIPWVVAAPGIRRGVDLNSDLAPPDVHTEDTFATACFLLGLTPPADVDGRMVLEILENRSDAPGGGELLEADRPAVAPTTRPVARAAP